VSSKARNNIGRRCSVLLARYFRDTYTCHVWRRTANALARLRREIQTVSNPASVMSTGAPWIVPFEWIPHFIGRETQLKEEVKSNAMDKKGKRGILEE
jgi:hypothetical protein